MILQVQLVSDKSLHEVMPQILRLQTLCAREFFNFNMKTIIFEVFKPIFERCFQQSMVTVSLNKNCVCFSRRFLQNKIGQ